MRGGQVVTYVDGAGTSCPATICGLPGSGPAGIKILDVRLSDGRVVANVAHQSDHAEGAGYWTLDPIPSAPAAKSPPPAWRPGRRREE